MSEPIREKILRKPDWLKTAYSIENNYSITSATIREGSLHTICTSGKCPNRSTCWNAGTATFMIGGNICTRACRFCATQSSKTPPLLNPNEPRHVAESIRKMRLNYVVLTSVDRDDLEDGGASHWSETIHEIKRIAPSVTVEVLLPDFSGDKDAISEVLRAMPDVVAHNLETVERLTPDVRHKATYSRSLEVLRFIHDSGFITKTGIMVGLGEQEEEVVQTMEDACDSGVSTMTIGQYLQPTKTHIPVIEYIHPDTFNRYKQIGETLGLTHVESGPLVRSSFRAEKQFSLAKQKQTLDLKDLIATNR